MKIPFLKKKLANNNQADEKVKLGENLFDNVSDVHDLYISDGMIETPLNVKLGTSMFSRVYRVEIFPPEIHIGWLDDIFTLGYVDVSVHLLPTGKSSVIRALTKKITSLKAQYNLDARRGNELKLPELEQAISDLEVVRKAIQTNRDKLFYCSILIAIHATSEEELQKKTTDLEDLLQSKSAYPRALFLRQVEGIKSLMPVANMVVKDKWHNLTRGGVASMMPISNPDLSHGSGVLLGRTTYSGAPVFYNSFLGPPNLPNPHIFVCGWSGSGKSYFLDLFTMRSRIMDVRTAIVDPEREHVLITKELGGTVIRIAPGYPSGINPLDLSAEVDEKNKERIDIIGKVQEIKWLVNVMVTGHGGRTLTPEELSVVEDAAREVYRDRNITEDPESLFEYPEDKSSKDGFHVGKVRKDMPTLSDLVERIGSKEAGKDLAIILRPFLAGGTLGMFDGQATVNIDEAPVICFDIKDISDEFTRLYAMYVVLSWVWWKFALRRDGKRKRLVVDEAWRFMKHRDSIMFLEEIARRGRKHKISLAIASQTFNEFTASDEGKAVLWSCATMALFQPHPNQMDTVVSEFGLSEGCREFLDEAYPGDCLLMINRSISAVTIQATPYEHQLLESKNRVDKNEGVE